MKFLITGGNGFIGSNFIELALSNSNIHIINLDNETYAGQGRNIEHLGLDKHPNYKYYKADICDKEKVLEIFRSENPDIVINFAAESHVDRSITNPLAFVNTNVIGAGNLLEAAREVNVKKFIQISTDEVYGSLAKDSPSSKEGDLLNPRSPYSASKASAEQLALSYFHTFNLPVVITRSSNNYGPYQFPEKLIPLFTTNLFDNKKVPLMYSKENPGENVRDWIYVKDNCEAILHLATDGKPGEIYNISGRNERTNIQITNALLRQFNKGPDMINPIPHRKGHDFRYSIDDSKLGKIFNEKPRRDFNEAIKETVQWYNDNEDWWRPIKKFNGVVFGAGYLGQRISGDLGLELSKINLLNFQELEKFLDERKPEVVINCVGKTGRPNIDWCEDHKEDTFLSNISAAINLSALCSKKGIYFVHIGSGCIYQGDNLGKGFKENDKSNHKNTYTISKVLSEEALREFPGLQLRIRMPLDDRPLERNFIDKIKKYDKLIDEENSITSVPHLINALRKLISMEAQGIYNMTNPGTISAARVMNLYKEIVDPNHQFEVISVGELNSITKAKRSNCLLNTNKLENLGIKLPNALEATRECLIGYKENLK